MAVAEPAQVLERATPIAGAQVAGKTRGQKQDAHAKNFMTYYGPESFQPDASCRSVRILLVATKSPDPPCDGGRLALRETLRALAEAGHELVVVAPRNAGDDSPNAAQPASYRLQAIATRPRSVAVSLLHAVSGSRSLSVARHRQVELDDAVAQLVATWRPDVVHAEQLQAFANCASARARGIATVLRMQNVESDLRLQESRLRSQPLLRVEARRLRADERRAMVNCARTIAISQDDADQLVRIAPTGAVETVAPPFPARLSAAPALDGDPALVLAGSAGWWPNADGERWLLRHVWPRLCARLPRAVLHIFGGDGSGATDGVRRHGAPLDSQSAFPEGAIALVPLRVSSGVRLRILEAWARGLPVVATPAAARGLHVASGRELMIAATATDFAEAVALLHFDGAVRARVVENGRAYLRLHHDPVRQAACLAVTYAAAAARA